LERGRNDLLDLLGEVSRDAGREVVARFAQGFTGKFEEESSAGLPSEAPPLRGFGAKEGGGWSGGKLEGGGTGDGISRFFGSVLLRHGDFLAQIPPIGNGNIGGLAVSLLVMEGNPKLSTSLLDR
jgi:hypothetical protein